MCRVTPQQLSDIKEDINIPVDEDAETVINGDLQDSESTEVNWDPDSVDEFINEETELPSEDDLYTPGICAKKYFYHNSLLNSYLCEACVCYAIDIRHYLFYYVHSLTINEYPQVYSCDHCNKSLVEVEYSSSCGQCYHIAVNTLFDWEGEQILNMHVTPSGQWDPLR